MPATETTQTDRPAHPSAAPRGSIAIYVAASVGSGVAHLGTSTMPFQVGALMDGAGLSASSAGTFGFFEIGALALSMILISPLIHRYSAAAIALIGAALGIAAHLALYAATPHFLLLVMLAVMAGVGYGMVFAAVVSGVAACANADRIYSVANGGALVLIVALMAVLPYLAGRFGPLGPFLGIAIILALTAPAFAGFRNGPRARGGAHGPLLKRPGVGALLALWTASSLGTGALWSFAERIGHGLGLAPETVGFVLSASTFFGIAGTAVAAVTAGRLPRLVALSAGLTGTALACVMLGFAPGLAVYAVGVLLYWVFYMFLYSYLLGTAASIDPSGQVGTAGGGFERFGFAVGAPVGGLIVDHASFAALGVFGGLSCVALIPFCIPAIRRAFGR